MSLCGIDYNDALTAESKFWAGVFASTHSESSGPADRVMEAIVKRMEKFPTSPEGLLTTHAYTATASMIRWLEIGWA